METSSNNPQETQSQPAEKPKNKGGRPSKAAIAEREGATRWAKEMLDLYEQGASDIEVCSHLRLTEKEFDKRYKEDDLFQRLVQIGRLRAKAFWYSQQRHGLRDKTFNTILYIKTMQNRYGWADKSENTERKPLDQMDENEMKEELDSLLKKYGKKFGLDPGLPTFKQLYERTN